MPRCRRCRVKDFGLGFAEKPPFLCPRCADELREKTVCPHCGEEIETKNVLD